MILMLCTPHNVESNPVVLGENAKFAVRIAILLGPWELFPTNLYGTKFEKPNDRTTDDSNVYIGNYKPW